MPVTSLAMIFTFESNVCENLTFAVKLLISPFLTTKASVSPTALGFLDGSFCFPGGMQSYRFAVAYNISFVVTFNAVTTYQR